MLSAPLAMHTESASEDMLVAVHIMCWAVMHCINMSHQKITRLLVQAKQFQFCESNRTGQQHSALGVLHLLLVQDQGSLRHGNRPADLHHHFATPTALGDKRNCTAAAAGWHWHTMLPDDADHTALSHCNCFDK